MQLCIATAAVLELRGHAGASREQVELLHSEHDAVGKWYIKAGPLGQNYSSPAGKVCTQLGCDILNDETSDLP